jgi:hypothetical protein
LTDSNCLHIKRFQKAGSIHFGVEPQLRQPTTFNNPVFRPIEYLTDALRTSAFNIQRQGRRTVTVSSPQPPPAPRRVDCSPSGHIIVCE